jgi:hypothetical protein
MIDVLTFFVVLSILRSHSMPSNNPQRGWNEPDVPDQTGRLAIITGANSGTGFEAAKVLARHGATVRIESNQRSHEVEVQRRLRQVSEQLTGVRYSL